jgi:hypothetical protein
VLSVGNQPFAISDGRQHLLTLLSLCDMISLARTCHAWYATAAKPARRCDSILFNVAQACLGRPPTMAHHVHTIAFKKDEYPSSCFAYGRYFPSLTELHTCLYILFTPCSLCDTMPAFPTTLHTLDVTIVNRISRLPPVTIAAFWEGIGQLAVLRALQVQSNQHRSWAEPQRLTAQWFRGLTRLTTFELLGIAVNMDAEALRQLGSLPHLTELLITQFEWTPHRLRDLCSGPMMAPLQQFHGAVQITKSYLGAIQPMLPTLTQLGYKQNLEIHWLHLQHMSSMSNLIRLDITTSPGPNMRLMDTLAVPHFPKLKYLNLHSFVLEEADIALAARQWPHLTSLILEQCWTQESLLHQSFPEMSVVGLYADDNPFWTNDMNASMFRGMPQLITYIWVGLS